MSEPLLQIVTVSTRPHRKGASVSRWFATAATAHGRFAIESVDLQAVNLPLYDEAEHPRLRRYAHAHTQAWSEIVDRADAYVFVMPEYNFTPPPSLVNAVDYLLHEWAYKPVAIVSYGGASGGLRAAQASKLLFTAVRMMPIPEAVTLPFFTRQIDQDGVFSPSEPEARAAQSMLDELMKWTVALRAMRPGHGA